MDYDTAFKMIAEAGDDDDFPSLCKSIPAHLWANSSDLCYEAVQKNPKCYGLFPDSVLNDNWWLVDSFVEILKSNFYFHEETLAMALHYMPLPMRDCLLFFLQTPPVWLGECNERRKLYVQTHYSKISEPHVSREMGQKWLDNQPEIGYAMIPHKQEHAELLPQLVNSDDTMRFLKMVPIDIIQSHMTHIRTLLYAGSIANIQYIPEALRDDDMYFFCVRDLKKQKKNSRVLLRIIPDAVWERHPNWLQDILAFHEGERHMIL